MSKNTAHNTASVRKPAQPRRRRWLRRVVALLILLGLCAGVTLWVITRSQFIIARVTPELERKLGGEVAIDHAAYEGDGRFVFTNLTLRVRGLAGPAGEIFRVGTAIVLVDDAELWRGSVVIEAVELHEARLRTSEHMHESGRFAFMDLQPVWGDPDTERKAPPRIEFPNALLEFGNYVGDQYEPHGHRRMSGVMHPAADAEHWYNFQLSEVDPDGVGLERGILINGRWNAATHEFTSRMDGLELDEHTYSMGPQVVRMWWDRLDLEGRIANASVQWSESDGLTVAAEILDVGLTLPVEAGEWARYQGGRIVGLSGPQTMRVKSGWIRLDDNALMLDSLVGEIGDEATVPYKVTMSVSALPALDWRDRQNWMDDVLARAPFRMTFELQDFRVGPDEHGMLPGVDLPRLVAKTLELFQLSDWRLSTNIVIERGDPVDDGSGRLVAQPIESHGQVYIAEASGSYEKFPYPLTGVNAYLKFDQDHVAVEYVTGTAAGGGTVRLSGELYPPGRDARVQLRLTGRDIPVDQQLRAALPETHQAVFDGLMHGPSDASLRAAGLLTDEQALESIRQQRREAVRQLALAHATDAADPTSQTAWNRPELEQRVARLDALIEAGAFSPGGVVDLDITIERAGGPDQPTVLGGEVTVQHLDALVSYFPYPFTVTGGTVRIEPDGVSIVADDHAKGLPIITHGGGRGYIAGSMRREDDRLVPDIHIRVANDAVNDLVYTAIPGADHADEAPEADVQLSQSASLLEGIGLAGSLDYFGAITEGDDGRIDFAFEVNLLNGTAEPQQELADALGTAGLLWPTGWAWDDVRATVRISRDAIELVGLSGRFDQGRVAASGVIDLRQDPADIALDVRFDDLALGPYLIDLMPADGAELARTLWDQYQPQGTFNAHLQYQRIDGVAGSPLLMIEPVRAVVHIDDEPVTLTSAGGRLSLESSVVTFDELALDIARSEQHDGRIVLSGAYGVAEDGGDLSARGRWKGARVESPLIGEALRLIGAEGHVDRLQSWDLAGTFDAEFEYDSPQGDQPRMYRFEVQPQSLTAVVNDTPVAIDFRDDARVVLTPGWIDVKNLSGEHDGGSLAVTGRIRAGDLLEATLRISHDGRLMSDLVQALAPAPVRDVLAQLEFDDGQGTSVRDARLRLAQVLSEDDETQWRADFRGAVNTSGASFNAGLSATEIDGLFDVIIRAEPGGPPLVQIDAAVDHMRLMGRALSSVHAENIMLSPDGRTMVMENLRGEAYGGAVWAAAQVGVGDNQAYSASLDFVGVSIADALADTEDEAASGNLRGARGELYGGVKIHGLRGDPAARSGRGSVRAIGGSLANLPLIVQIMQLTQFTVPLRADLDHADVTFYLNGDRVVFERILLESTVGPTAALQLIGNGDMNMQSFELNTHFRSRGGMLVIRDLVGGLSDQLYAIEVTGTLREPRARIVPLPGITQPRSTARSRQESAAALIGGKPR